MCMWKWRFALLIVFISFHSRAASILIPMDEVQKNHLKAYGVAFLSLKEGIETDWLLNYRGGSFLMNYYPKLELECKVRGVTYQTIADGEVNRILTQISDPQLNMDIVKLEKAPKIAVYSPKNKLPWDDAVTLVLNYAEIPYDIIYDEEIIKGDILPKYDWLHLHHEDFTGQYGRFWQRYQREPWYIEDVKSQENTANKLGYAKVSKMKLDVAKGIRNFVSGGGFMFAMCTGTDTYDIALAAEGTDICEAIFDGDGSDPNAQSKLDFSQTFAFQNFDIFPVSRFSMSSVDFSNIDVSDALDRGLDESNDFFALFDFSAKWDAVPSMLTQSHDKVIKGFMGLTTEFRKDLLKPNVLVMGETKATNSARYIHGEFGKGQWTFYGGHDPEDYQHQVGEDPTDLNLHPNSPGYRLILNNVLFPAAKKKKQKT